jgi:hypothetical protein
LLVAVVVTTGTSYVVPTRSLAEPLQAAHELSNKDVLDLVKDRLATDIVVAKVERSACRFDASPSALIQLKAAGVRVEPPTRSAAAEGTSDVKARACSGKRIQY